MSALGTDLRDECREFTDQDAADAFGTLFAFAHGRAPSTQADRLIGERMRAHAARMGLTLQLTDPRR